MYEEFEFNQACESSNDKVVVLPSFTTYLVNKNDIFTYQELELPSVGSVLNEQYEDCEIDVCGNQSSCSISLEYMNTKFDQTHFELEKARSAKVCSPTFSCDSGVETSSTYSFAGKVIFLMF